MSVGCAKLRFVANQGRRLLDRVLAGVPAGESPLTHTEVQPARPAQPVAWPSWTPEPVVSALVVGLPAYVLVKVLVPNFFARKDTRTPVYTAGAALLVNVALNFLLVPRLGTAAMSAARRVS